MVLVFAVVFTTAIGCKRKSKEFGGTGKAQPLVAQPQYASNAAVSIIPGNANISDVAPVGPDAPADGAKLYATNCAVCHQATGKGVPGAFPPLDQSPYVVGDNVERMGSIMLYGLIGPIKVLGADYNNAMVAFGPQLNDKELAAIATYVRSSWGNKAQPVEAATFAKLRQKWGARGPFQISELGEEK